MLSILGYNFSGDMDSLNISPTEVDNITSVQLQNGIYDHLNVTRDVTSVYSSTVPSWDFNTVLDANFNGNINAGNIHFVVEQVTSIKIKRRVKNTFNWITLTEIPVTSVESLTFSYNDYFNKDDTEYEYAFVPMLNNIEGEYIINSVESQFDGVFLCDEDTIYKFYADVGYDTMNHVQKVGVFEPIGRKYPIVVANADTSYNTGAMTATVLDDNYETTHEIDRQAVVSKMDGLLAWLSNKQAKVLKDWNGAIYLIMVTGNPSVGYSNNYGMGVQSINVSWTEIGDPEDQTDLYQSGLVKVGE